MPETQKNKRRYTSEFKESVLKRLKPPTSETVASLSDELGIPKGTIYVKGINATTCLTNTAMVLSCILKNRNTGLR